MIYDVFGEKHLIPIDDKEMYELYANIFSIHPELVVIDQNDKPIAFWSKKINSVQTWYTTTEKELVSTLEVCKAFRTIL